MSARVAALLLAGCASSPRTQPRAECTIAQPAWTSAEDSYDRAATIDALTAIERVIADAASAGPDQVARRLDTLFRQPRPAAFVSRWTVDAAIRLRQLACAHQTGKLSQAEADQRYVQVINDIEDERAVIVDEMRRHEK
jgi:hypothetical protein